MIMGTAPGDVFEHTAAALMTSTPVVHRHRVNGDAEVRVEEGPDADRVLQIIETTLSKRTQNGTHYEHYRTVRLTRTPIAALETLTMRLWTTTSPGGAPSRRARRDR